MRKFAISIGVLAVAAAGCGNDGGGNNEADPAENNTNTNNEVTEEPEADLADNNENEEEDDLNAENNEDAAMNENNNAMNEDEEETEAVMDQDFNDFNLTVTLVDDTEWEFSYTPAENEDEEPEANITGEDLEVTGENAVEEMETYLSEFNVNAASEQEEITSEIADNFDFNEEDFQEYNLMIDFAEQENETEWSWTQDEEGSNGENNAATENEENDPAADEENDTMNTEENNNG